MSYRNFFLRENIAHFSYMTKVSFFIAHYNRNYKLKWSVTFEIRERFFAILCNSEEAGSIRYLKEIIIVIVLLNKKGAFQKLIPPEKRENTKMSCYVIYYLKRISHYYLLKQKCFVFKQYIRFNFTLNKCKHSRLFTCSCLIYLSMAGQVKLA